jgi:glycogen/starch/alpha-glucan phosphorylase-like protein
LGQALRFVQEYFLVACSLTDLARRFQHDHSDWSKFPDKIALQLNDTHPTLAVPELMRILLDDAHQEWDQAWDITQRTLAYTNHTLLPEALEKWPLHYFQQMLPRHLEIIFEINRRFLDDVRRRYPGDEARVGRVSLIEEGPEQKVRMANLAIVGSHSTNGVAAIHSELLRTMTVRDLAEMFPERFNNKTNGVTPRRWLLLANPELARTITGAIGEGWKTDLSQLSKLRPLERAAANILLCRQSGAGKDPSEHYDALTAEFGTAHYTRIDAPATGEEKAKLENLSPEAVDAPELAMVFKLVDTAQKSWRRLDGHNQSPKLIQGVKFTDGIEVAANPASLQSQTAAA